MDYEKKYKEALEQAKKELAQSGPDSDSARQILRFFPELTESEDERIRKVIHKILLAVRKDVFTAQDKIVTKDKALAYLEKQKESHFTKRNALFDKCVANCDPMVMKKVSDEIDERLQKEQKQPHHLANSYSVVSPKEAEEEITKFMLENSLNPEQKPAGWSEEDEKNLEQVIDVVYDYCPDPVAKYKLKDWLTQRLKSLRPHWKPSKEQMDRLVSIVAALRKDCCDDMADFLAEIYHELEKL